jgi:hypothetical protein
MSGYAMAEFLKLKHVHRRTLKSFLLTQATRVNGPVSAEKKAQFDADPAAYREGASAPVSVCPRRSAR